MKSNAPAWHPDGLLSAMAARPHSTARCAAALFHLQPDALIEDAILTLQQADVISDERRQELLGRIDALRQEYCKKAACCADCMIGSRCTSIIVDLLGS